jgi:hypothetical protein
MEYVDEVQSQKNAKPFTFIDLEIGILKLEIQHRSTEQSTLALFKIIISSTSFTNSANNNNNTLTEFE